MKMLRNKLKFQDSSVNVSRAGYHFYKGDNLCRTICDFAGMWSFSSYGKNLQSKEALWETMQILLGQSDFPWRCIHTPSGKHIFRGCNSFLSILSMGSNSLWTDFFFLHDQIMRRPCKKNFFNTRSKQEVSEFFSLMADNVDLSGETLVISLTEQNSTKTIKHTCPNEFVV